MNTFNIPTREQINNLRNKFPSGTRIKLIKMNDAYSRLKPGTIGTVTNVDDIGTIHMKWDTGSTLGLVEGEDDFEIFSSN